MKSLGDLIVTGIGFLAIIRVWRVFPFEFGSTSFDWALLVRIALAIGFFGSIAAMIVQLFMLVANVSRVRH